MELKATYFYFKLNHLEWILGNILSLCVACGGFFVWGCFFGFCLIFCILLSDDFLFGLVLDFFFFFFGNRAVTGYCCILYFWHVCAVKSGIFCFRQGIRL